MARSDGHSSRGAGGCQRPSGGPGTMATVHVTYWRDIPVLVTARDEREEVSVPLGPAFQELVDRVAVQEGLEDADAYLAEWRVGPDQSRPGPAATVACALPEALGAQLEPLRGRYLGAPRPAESSSPRP